jgi:hypothetical protein
LPDATVGEIMDALAEQMMDVLCGTVNPVIEQLQVEPRMVFNPTPPAIDIYPADPFTEQIAYGPGNRELMFIVRARVSTVESEGGQDLLLSMMDPREPTSVAGAVEASSTLGGVVEDVSVEGPTGFGVFPSVGTDGNLLGCTWTVAVLP